MLNLASIFATPLSQILQQLKILTKNQHCHVPHGYLQSIFGHAPKQCQIKFYIKDFLLQVGKDIMTDPFCLY